VQDYYNINTPSAKLPLFQAQILEVAAKDRASQIDGPPDTKPVNLSATSPTKAGSLPDVGENVQGRTGGAVTLAMGMAYIMDGAVKNIIGSPAKPPSWLDGMFRYWYHFAIMFEALFILTTIDTGTRVGRFLLQETFGKWIHPSLGKTNSWPSAILTTAIISLAWWYFLDANAFSAIWAMFGVANQMLAVIALAVATAALARGGKKQYLAVTVIPMIFVSITTGYAAILLLIQFAKSIAAGENGVNPYISAACLIAILLCTAVVVVGAVMEMGSTRKPLPVTVA
jgi:carbon starvation protein